MILAKRITRARKEAGFTKAELAKLINKSRSSVYEYEAGDHEPRLAVLRLIAKVCHVDLKDLVA